MKYNLPELVYTPLGWKYTDVNHDQIKKEYQRLRKNAVERLRKLKKAGYEDSETYRRFKNYFPAYSDIKSNTALGINLSNVRYFLELQSSTPGGIHKMEKKVLKQLHDSGYTFVNRENLKAFGDYMEAVRSKYGGVIYGSDQVADLFGATIDKALNPKELLTDFEYWRDNVYELEKSRQKRNDLNTLANYRKTIERRKKRARK